MSDLSTAMDTLSPEVGTDAPGGPESGPSAEAPATGPARNPDGTFAPTSPAGGVAADEPSFHDLAAEYESLASSEGDVVQLPKDKLGKWNNEHKAYRERFQPYERAFKGLHPDDAQEILRFVEALNDEDTRPQAAEWMRQVLDKLSPAQQAQVANAVAAAQDSQAAAPTEEDFDPFDPAQVDARIERMVEARLQRAEQERAQKEAEAEAERKIQSRAKELGYPDPATPDYALLLLTARKQFASDPDPLGRAAEEIDRRLNDRATQILKAKRADAQQQTIPPDGAAPSGSKRPTSMRDAETAARQRLDAILSGNPQP